MELDNLSKLTLVGRMTTSLFDCFTGLVMVAEAVVVVVVVVVDEGREEEEVADELDFFKNEGMDEEEEEEVVEVEAAVFGFPLSEKEEREKELLNGDEVCDEAGILEEV